MYSVSGGWARRSITINCDRPKLSFVRSSRTYAKQKAFYWTVRYRQSRAQTCRINRLRSNIPARKKHIARMKRETQ